jgi:ribosomal protein S18 acetylase RimI-like enzyme
VELARTEAADSWYIVDGMGEVTVRRAVKADLAGVTALLEDADALHREALPWLFREVDGASLIGFLEAFVSKDDHAMFLAAAPDGSLAGVVYMFVREPSRAPIVEPAVVAEISALVVAPAFRRRRVGTHLVEAALRWAKDAGAARTELSVFAFNEPARAFWESIGFQTLWRRLVLQTGSRS